MRLEIARIDSDARCAATLDKLITKIAQRRDRGAHAKLDNDEPINLGEPFNQLPVLSLRVGGVPSGVVGGDFLLIYRLEGNAIIFVRAGTHSESFEE